MTTYKTPIRLSDKTKNEILDRRSKPTDAPSEEREYPQLVTELSTSPTPINEDNFKLLIRQWIKHNGYTTFSFPTLSSVPEITQVAKRVLVDQYQATDITPSRLTALFNRVLTKLQKEGEIFVLDEDSFEVINHYANLGMALLSIIKEETIRLEDPTAGIPTHYAIVRIKDWQKERFKHVKSSSIIQSLGLLVDSSDIYEVNKGEYRSF
ncbi:hypothetical protein HDV00_000458 [Rhizophlyctis rosea]|nr:hypothetical protein HDV00_000458 [Rhizophlyctis rosea]